MTCSGLVAQRLQGVPPQSFLRLVALVQGVVYVLTGVWPLVHMASFLAVTGPKTDLWLVNTVGVLVAVIGAVLLTAVGRGLPRIEIRLLGAASAAALAAIDIYYVTAGVIWPIYLADAVFEIVLAAAWGILSMVIGRAETRI